MIFDNIENVMEILKNNENVEFLKKTLVLASASMARAKIMKNAGFKFITIPSFADEEKLKQNFGKVDCLKKAEEYVLMLSGEKAKWLGNRLKNVVIVGADTIVFNKNEKLEKPKDEEDARRILSILSGSTHLVITGVCIIDGEKEDNFVKVSEVKMLEIPKEVQEEIIKNKLTYTYAGGYSVDGPLRNKIVISAEDFNNVLGLPIERIINKFKEAGYDFSRKN